MSHLPTRDALVALATSTTQDPSGFLDGLSEIHDDWHRQVSRDYGFLLFHNRVIRYFDAIVRPAVQPTVEPYSAEELDDLGVAPFSTNLDNVDVLAEMAAFSTAIESWHNTAHGTLGAATGTPMHDPRQNIFFRPFWQLHLYIDGLFATVLRQYGDRAHAGQFNVPIAITGHIEARHHGWVPRI